jgi:hypothetical protein
MKRILITAAALSALAMAQTPAFAQYDHDRWDHDRGDYGHDDDRGDRWDVDQRITWVEDRIARAQEDGSIRGDVAWRARNQLADVRRDETRDRYRYGGRLPEAVRDSLLERVDSIGRSIRWQDEEWRAPWNDR